MDGVGMGGSLDLALAEFFTGFHKTEMKYLSLER